MNFPYIGIIEIDINYVIIYKKHIRTRSAL